MTNFKGVKIDLRSNELKAQHRLEVQMEINPTTFELKRPPKKSYQTKEYRKNYYLKNKERILKKCRQYKLINFDLIKKKTKLYNQKIRQRKIDKYYNNIEEMRRKNRENYYKFKDKRAIYAKKYRLKNRERMLEYQRKQYRELKDYYIKKNIAYAKRAREIGSSFAIALRLRNRIRGALNKFAEGKKVSSRKYGIDYGAIINYLSPFPKNIKEYHIDHIKPLCMFDLTNPDEIKKAFAPENHQWLLAKENMRKNRFYNERPESNSQT